MHPDDLPEFDRNITHLAPGQRSECDLRILAKDVCTHYIQAYSMVVESADDTHRLYGACQDITDRRRAKEALRESEGRFRAMAEPSADWIWSIDVQGRHTYSNQRGVDMLGYAQEAFLSVDISSLVHPEDLPLFHETFAKAISTRQGWQNIVLRWRHRDGSYRILESNASAQFNEAGQLIGFHGVDRDTPSAGRRRNTSNSWPITMR